MWRPATCALLVWAVVSGCATTSAPRVLPAKIAIAESFEMSGRISVRVGERLDIAKIVWVRSVASERLALFSPFGTQIAEAVRDGSGATFQRGTETLSATSIAALTEPLLGTALDTDEIARWLQGDGLVEDEATDKTQKDGSVWRVTAEKFQPQWLPDRIVTRLSASKGDTLVRLFVDSWQRK